MDPNEPQQENVTANKPTCDCSSAGDNVSSCGRQLNTNKSNFDTRPACKKCGASSYVVLDKVHVQCRDCFLESCNKKVRSTIGKSKLLRNNDSILVAYSGGPSSTTLLSLIKNSIEYDARREQKFRPSILYIDTRSSLSLQSDAEWEERKDNLKHLLDSTHKLYPDWPLYWTTLEMWSNKEPYYSLYKSHDDLQDLYLKNVEAYQALELAIKSRDLTDRQRFVQTCISELIDKVAQNINSTLEDTTSHFKFAFTASSSTQLANNLLVDVILGQGATIHSTVSICDFRPVVPIVRPMRDFSKKEIAFYLKARNLEIDVQPNLATFADRKASIQTLTESFLSKLYVDYPSTYSTLLRTGNKMQDA